MTTLTTTPQETFDGEASPTATVQTAEFEVVSEPTDFCTAVLGGQRFAPERMSILPCELTARANRALGRDDLFLWRHRETGNFFLAVWFRKPDWHDGRGGVFTSLETLKGFPGHSTCTWYPSTDWLRMRLRPWAEQRRETMIALRERDYRKAVENNNTVESRRAYAKFLRARGHSEYATRLERGEIYWESESEKE